MRAACRSGFCSALLLLLLPGCGPGTRAVSTPPPGPATPDPHEDALIEHAVRDRLAEENRITEQQLANARAAASQRLVGREMFQKLEQQYRQRQEEIERARAAREGPAAPTVSPR